MKKKILFGVFVFSVVMVFLTGAAAAKDKIVIGQAIALSGPLAGGVAIAGGPIYELWVARRSTKMAGSM